ncbi:MAG: PQQ-binding-like beta-propeller repeat protein [Caldisericia bacterium]|nr:PQQ-binding-like beta-propeller repeat protein [Caldisericia bacterium]
MDILRKVCIVFLICELIGVGFPPSIFSTEKNLIVSQHNISFTLTESQTDKKAFSVTNDSQKKICFSIIKEGVQEAPSLIADEKNPENSEEIGSTWVTPQYNFSRTGYNEVESALPPYSQKWRHKSNKPLLSPVLSGDNLYLPSEKGTISLINNRTGVKNGIVFSGNPISSVHLYQRYLIISTNKSVVLVDRISKLVIWEKPYVVRNIYGIAVWEGLIFLGTQTRFVCIDMITGTEEWSEPGNCSTISVYDGSVFSVINDSYISISSCRSGEKIASIKCSNPLSGPLVCSKNQLYFCQSDIEKKESTVSCAKVDGEILWEYSIEDYINSSIAVDEKSIYFATGNGTVRSLDRFTGKKIWAKITNSTVLISPVIASGMVFIGCNNGELLALDLENGEKIWNAKLSFPISSPIVIAHGFIYLVDNKNSMYAFCKTGENVIPPYAPARLKGFPGNKVFTLTWAIEQPKPDLKGFHIYRQKEWESDFSYYDDVGVVNNYQDTNVVNGERYKYIVRAYDTYGNESTSSRMVSGIPSQDQDPLWLDYSPTGGILNPGETITITLKADAKLVPVGAYRGKITIIQSGTSDYSHNESVYVTLDVKKSISKKIDPPQLLHVSGSDSRALVQWKKYPGIWNYQLYRSKVSMDEMSLIATLNATEILYTDDKVNNGDLYFYSMKAVSENGQTSDFSNEISIVPAPLALEINKNTNITVLTPIFEISGRADPKAELSANGNPIDKDSKGFFKCMVGVPAGVSNLIFKAVATDKSVQNKIIEVNCFIDALEIKLQIDNQIVLVNSKLWPWLLDSPPIIKDSRTFVPLRFISEIVGGKVIWNSQEKRIEVLYKQNEVVLWIGKKEILVNSKKEVIDTAPFISKGRTMVPLRFVTEPLGAVILWDGASQSITLSFAFTQKR